MKKEIKINDGILEIWERVPPDGDWEGRTASQKNLDEYIKGVRQQEKERIVKMIDKVYKKEQGIRYWLDLRDKILNQ